jgi:cobalt-zinc-cadmium efflux system outer membrane protein
MEGRVARTENVAAPRQPSSQVAEQFPDAASADGVRQVDFDAIAFTDPSFDSFLEEVDVVALGQTDDESAGLTLDELESVALAQHPAIAEAEAKVAALRGKWLQVGLKPNPFAQYNGEEIGNAENSLQIASIGQTIVTANKLSLNRQVVAAEIDQARANLDAARTRVLSDVRAEFQNALVAQERLEMTSQLREIAEKSLQSVDAMNRASEASRIDLLQAQTVLQQAELAVETASAGLDGVRARLAAVASIDKLPNEQLIGTIGIDLELSDYDAIASELVASSPEIASRVAEISRAQQALRLACATITPNVIAMLGVGVDTSTDDTFGAIQVTVPLPITNRNQGNIRRTRAQITEADRALRRTELELNWRLANALQSYEVARLQRNRFRDEIVPRAEETLTLSIQAFDAGESSYLQLLTVQRTLFEARLSLLAATGSATQAANLINNYLLSGIPPK